MLLDINILPTNSYISAPFNLFITDMRTVSKRSCQTLAYGSKHAHDQILYLKSVINENGEINDWPQLKSKILAIPGTINLKNVDAVLLKILINEKKLNIAQSFAKYLLSFRKELNLGAKNGILNLYVELHKTNKLSDEGKKFIMDTFRCIYYRYQVPDSTTCERLLHALCAINEWQKAIKVLEDIRVSCTPTHSAYSTLIATLFKVNRKTDAFRIIEQSISAQRPLLDIAYEEWINYIRRKYNDKKTITKYLDELCMFVSRNFIVIPEQAAEKLKAAYETVGWTVRMTKIKKHK